MLSEKMRNEMREELERRRQPGYAKIARRQFWQFAAYTVAFLVAMFALLSAGHGFAGAWLHPNGAVAFCVCAVGFLLSALVAYLRWQDLRRARFHEGA
jgi:hypothetical protein